MHESQPMPLVHTAVPPAKPTKIKFWSAAAGFAAGAALAGGILGFLLWQQHRRHQDELVRLGVVNPAALLAKAISGEGSNSANAGGLLGGLFSPAQSMPAKNETSPTKDEIAAYLDGKTLPLPDSIESAYIPGGKSSKSCVMKKDSVEAVEKGTSSHWNSEPWSTSIIFLYNSDDGRYAVDATIMHKPVGDKTAYFGLNITRVAKQ